MESKQRAWTLLNPSHATLHPSISPPPQSGAVQSVQTVCCTLAGHMTPPAQILRYTHTTAAARYTRIHIYGGEDEKIIFIFTIEGRCVCGVKVRRAMVVV